MNAKEYTTPLFEVITFEVEDVIVTSEPTVTEVPTLKDDVF